MPWRENEDTGQIVIVPGHFFFAEEAADETFAGRGVGEDEEVVEEACYVEKD